MLRFSSDGVDANQPMFVLGIEQKTTPESVLGMSDELAVQRIHMHVLELFNFLLQAPNIEVVEAALPKSRQRIFVAVEAELQLASRRAALATQFSRDALFQDLHHSGGASVPRLADQHMHVLGHNHVTHQRELVAVAHLTQYVHKDVSGANRAQQRYAAITTKCNEVQMAVPVVANQSFGHKTENPNRPFENREGSGTLNVKTILQR